MPLPNEQPVIIHPTAMDKQCIYEYANGRRILVEVEDGSGQSHAIREI